jgi:hypothetical protein
MKFEAILELISRELFVQAIVLLVQPVWSFLGMISRVSKCIAAAF